VQFNGPRGQRIPDHHRGLHLRTPDEVLFTNLSLSAVSGSLFACLHLLDSTRLYSCVCRSRLGISP
jgi:hypothetical protein